MLFHSEQQRKTLGVPSEGFSIPNSCVERFDDVVANYTSRNSDNKR